MHKKFQVNQTKTKGGCQSETKAAQQHSCIDLTLEFMIIWIALHFGGNDIFNRPDPLFTDHDGHSRVDQYKPLEQFLTNNHLD